MVKTIEILTNFVDLVEVLEKTGNMRVATAILDGTYVDPQIDTRVKASTHRRRYADDAGWEEVTTKCTFQTYDKWKEEVHYTERYADTNASTGYAFRTMSLEQWNNLPAYVEAQIAEEISEMRKHEDIF